MVKEDRLVHYLVEMADMGFGLSRQEVMRLAFQIAEKSGMKHPFKNLLGFKTQISLFVHQKHSHMQGQSQSIRKQLKTFLRSWELFMFS